MAQERLSVRKIREILRLHDAGLSNRAIARACNISNSTVGEYLQRAQQASIGWPLPEALGEEALYQKLFPENNLPAETGRPLPDWEAIRKELKKRATPSNCSGLSTRPRIPRDTNTRSSANTTGVGPGPNRLPGALPTSVER